jgi:hypothetical protein
MVSRPAVQWVGLAVRRFEGRRKSAPHGGPGVAQQQQRVGRPAIGQRGERVVRCGLKAAAQQQARLSQGFLDGWQYIR